MEPHVESEEEEEEETGFSLGFIARASRIFTGLDSRRTRRRARLQTDSSDSDDDDYIPGEEEQDEDEDEDEEQERQEQEQQEQEEQESGSEESYHSCGNRAMSSGSDGSEASQPIDHAIAQATALRHSASEGSIRLGHVRRGKRVNVATMLAGREFNVSGNGRFSRAECCHVGARFLPTDGPSCVDRLDSRAYIGQFSGDGTLFVAGFQVR